LTALFGHTGRFLVCFNGADISLICYTTDICCLSYKNEQTKNKHVEIQVLPQSNKTIAVVLAQQVRKGGVSAIVP
jgi:hypothetical protein